MFLQSGIGMNCLSLLGYSPVGLMADAIGVKKIPKKGFWEKTLL